MTIPSMPSEPAELVPIRARIPVSISAALSTEALARRVPAGRLLTEILTTALPSVAAERVRRSLGTPASDRVDVEAADA